MAGQNLNSATRAARSAALNQLDSLGSSRSEFSTEEVFSVVEKDVAKFIDKIHQNVQDSGIVNTGEILDIRMRVNGDSIDVIAPIYLTFQDKGVQGSESSAKAPNSPFKYSTLKPPAATFTSMIKKKNIRLRNNEFMGGNPSPHSDIDGDERAINSLSYAIRESIFKEGFKPKNLYSDLIPELVTNVTKTISDFTTGFITGVVKDQYGTDVVKKGLSKKK